MREGLLAGFKYWAVIFALGFVLGVLRQTLLAPVLGPLLATAMELPFMLAASWLWCGRLIARRAWPAGAAERRIMAASAFILLMLAELLLDGLFGRHDPMALVRAWLQPAGALGLAGQILYGLFPMWVARTAAHHER